MSYVNFEGYFRRIHALLAIKPPNASNAPLQISRSSTQLIDIPATVADLLGIDAPATDGTSVFRLSEATPREIHLYAGVYTTTGDGKVMVLGTSMSETELAHVSYTASKGWTAYPNLPARAE
jgi:arylsulfatase A-like enzyme